MAILLRSLVALERFLNRLGKRAKRR